MAFALVAIVNAICMLAVFGFTAYAVVERDYSGWWFLLAFFVAAMVEQSIKMTTTKRPTPNDEGA